MPTDLNPYGGAFGGWIMSQMALGAASLASRYSKGRAILKAASDFEFPAGLVAGEELSVYATHLHDYCGASVAARARWRRDTACRHRPLHIRRCRRQ
jgi:acyl-CoA hydrolase